MKAIINALLFVLFISVLIVGNTHWKNTTSNLNSNTHSVSYTHQDYYIDFAKSWPEGAQKKLRTVIQNKGNFQILLLGSASIGESDLGLFSNLKETITNTYNGYVSLETIVYDKTSSDFIINDETKNIVKKKPDMIIFEPFLLTDNNVVGINTTLTNISTIIEKTKNELPDATFVIQPANPIYNANLYPKQVSALKDYAETKKITYLDHWKIWPEGNSIEILDYINQDGTPNKKGYEIWSNYITNFLVTK